MKMEEKRKENVEERGREVKERESVRREEYTAGGRKDGRKGRIRRANFDDLNAIMDINDNIYDGLDYMPALFYTFMHSKLHVIYVQEEDGKLVALANCRFYPDSDDLVSTLSGRVRPSHQGHGLGASGKSPLASHLRKEHPLITSYVADTMYTPNIAEKMKNWKLLYHWNVLVYKLADRPWLSRVARVSQMALGAVRPFSLSYTNATQWLESSDQLIRFLSKYTGDLFPFGPTWMPTPANRSGQRYMLSVAKVYVSLDPSSTVDNISPSNLLPRTGHLTAEGRGPQRTRDGGQEDDIIGLSYSTVVQCKYGLRIDIYFYGDCEMIFLSHVYSHLLHYASITSDVVRLAVLLHFPLTIDSKNVEERLKKGMGGRMSNDVFSVTQAVQYKAEIPKAKL